MSGFFRISIPFAAIFILLVSSFVALFPQEVSAANETYRWTSSTTIVASGGDLQGETTFTASAPTIASLLGTMTYKTGCQFKLRMFVIANNTSAQLSDPQSIGGPGDGITNRCSPEIGQSYYNQTVPLQGTRPGPGDAPETQLQKNVSVTLYSPSPAAQSPQTVTFVWKNSAGQTVATTTSPQLSDTAGNSNDPNRQVVRYETSTTLEPGAYSVCPSAIVGCQSFTKVKYQGLPLTYGESLSARNIKVALELQVTRADKDPFSAGPVELSLQKADGTGPILNIQTDRFSTPGVPNSEATVEATINLRGTFENVEAQVYKICVVVTNTCENVTKDSNRDAEVTIRLSGAQAQQLTNTAIAAPPKTCAQEAKGIGWLFCPLIISMTEASTKLTEFIVGLLALKTEQIFINADTSPAYKAAWAGFRNIAYAILVIIGLIMVVSQIFNLEILSAYTLRKMLPGIIAAVVFVTFSWEIMEFLYNLSNDAAFALADIIQAPFQGVDSVAGAIEEGLDNTLQDIFLRAVLGILTVLGAAGVVIYAALGGVTVILALMASFALSLFSIFILLEARNVVAVLLVVFSAPAIISAAFEPFKPVFVFWRGLVVVIVATVPGVAIVLTMAGVGSLIAAAPGGPVDILTALIILIAGFAMVWTLFLQMDKITGFMGNVASKVTGKAQQALSSYRGNTLKRRFGEVQSGERKLGLGLERLGVGTGIQMASLAGRPGQKLNPFSKEGREGWKGLKEAAYFQSSDAARKLIERDHNRTTGGDDNMAIAQGAASLENYVRDYAERKKQQHIRRFGEGSWTEERQKEAEDEGWMTGRQIEASLGAIGSKTLKQAAFIARRTSATAYNDYDLTTDAGKLAMREEMALEDSRAIDAGLFNAVQIAGINKENKARVDIHGESFPRMMGHINEAYKRYKALANGSKRGKVSVRTMNPETGKPEIDQQTGQTIYTDVDLGTIGTSAGGQVRLLSNDEHDAIARGVSEYTTAAAKMSGRTEGIQVETQYALKRLGETVAKSQERIAAAQSYSTPTPEEIKLAQEQLTTAQDSLARVINDGTVPEDQKIVRQSAVRNAQEKMAKLQQQATAGQSYLDEAQREIIRQLASISAEQQVMAAYGTPENSRTYDKMMLAQEMPGMPGVTVASYIEQLRSTSNVFSEFERTYRQNLSASVQAQMSQQTAANPGNPAGPPPGAPPGP